jgi:hypothetical protein
MLKVIQTRIGKFFGLVPFFRRAATRFGVSSFAIWKRAILLYLRYGLGPREAVYSGAVDPTISPNADLAWLGRQRLLKHQNRFNPKYWKCIVDDKAVFYVYCGMLGLPVPPLYAIFDKIAGWTATGQVVSERAEWERFFQNKLPQEFVIKPAVGGRGRGVALYRRAGASFEDSSGRSFSPVSLYERLQSDPETRFVIQGRVFNHPELQRLSGTQSLQTVRIVTWITKDGDVEIGDTFIKLIVGDNAIDNYSYGHGNMVADIDPDTGALSVPVAAAPDGIGIKQVPVHPNSGNVIAGTILPHWSLARRLIDRTAPLFLPLRTIGWDVALTTDGVVLMEGNDLWGNSPELAAGPHVPAHRQQALARFMRRFTSEL